MHCPGIKFGVPELFWELLQASGEKTSLSSSSATIPRSGEPVNGIGSLGSSDCSLISGRATRDVAWRSRRCKGHKSLNLLVWNPNDRGDTDRGDTDRGDTVHNLLTDC